MTNRNAKTTGQDAASSIRAPQDTPSLKILDNLSDIEEFEIIQHGYSQVREMAPHFHPHRSSEFPSEITAEMCGEWQRRQIEGQSG
jgi:hypothetical protein